MSGAAAKPYATPDPDNAPATASAMATSSAGTPTSNRRSVNSCREGVCHSSGSTPTAMDPAGLEPATFALPARRSPS